jgi:hypothetical protein
VFFFVEFFPDAGDDIPGLPLAFSGDLLDVFRVDTDTIHAFGVVMLFNPLVSYLVLVSRLKVSVGFVRSICGHGPALAYFVFHFQLVFD